MDSLEDKKLEIVCKKLGCGYGLQLRLRLCGVGVWVYIETCQKNAENCDCVGVLLFCLLLCIALVVYVTRWEKNMWRSSEFVVERWMMKNDSTDRKMDRNKCTPEHQSTLVSSSINMRLC
jgi:hypothetical protein